MATEFHYNDGGTWRKAKELHYNDGGTWRKGKELWYNDGGTWRKVFTGAAVVNPLPVAASITTTEVDPDNATSTLNFFTDGTIQTIADGIGTTTNWFDPTTVSIGSSYWVRLTVTAGTAPAGAATGTWLALSTARTWTKTATVPGTNSATFTLEVAADAAGVTVLGSVTGIYMAGIVVT